jgi:hypothetical protein
VSSAMFCIRVDLLSGSLFSAVRGKNICLYEPAKERQRRYSYPQ